MIDYLSFNEAGAVYKGNTEISAVYKGNTLVWQKLNPRIVDASIFSPSGDENVAGNELAVTVLGEGSPSPEYKYQWRVNGIDQEGETASSYTTIPEQAGSSISCIVEVGNSAGVSRVELVKVLTS